MKAKSLQRMSTDELMQQLSTIVHEIKSKLRQEETQLRSRRHAMARTLGTLGVSHDSNGTAPRRTRKVKTYPELSKVIQQKRWAKTKGDKQRVKQLEAEERQIRAKLGVQKRSKAA